MNGVYNVWNDAVGENVANNVNEIVDRFNDYSNVFVNALNEAIGEINREHIVYKSERNEILELQATIEADIF